jgi:aryl-alcohol dehydrogenase-like predicted oxidoreductase
MIYAHELSLSNIELALGFVQSIEEVDKVIIGVNTVDQLYKIIDASKVKVNQNSYFDLAVFDTDYTNPSNWRL